MPAPSEQELARERLTKETMDVVESARRAVTEPLRARETPNISGALEQLEKAKEVLARRSAALRELAQKSAKAEEPANRLRQAEDAATTELNEKLGKISRLDAKERAALDAWTASGKSAPPEPQTSKRRELESGVNDARRRLSQIKTALADKAAALQLLNAEWAQLVQARDVALVNMLYEEAEVGCERLKEAAAELGKYYADLSGLNYALAQFKDLPREELTIRPVIGHISSPAIMPRHFPLSESSFEIPGFWLRACASSTIVSKVSVQNIRAAEARWHKYANQLADYSLKNVGPGK